MRKALIFLVSIITVVIGINNVNALEISLEQIKTNLEKSNYIKNNNAIVKVDDTILSVEINNRTIQYGLYEGILKYVMSNDIALKMVTLGLDDSADELIKMVNTDKLVSSEVFAAIAAIYGYNYGGDWIGNQFDYTKYNDISKYGIEIKTSDYETFDKNVSDGIISYLDEMQINVTGLFKDTLEKIDESKEDNTIQADESKEDNTIQDSENKIVEKKDANIKNPKTGLYNYNLIGFIAVLVAFILYFTKKKVIWK